MSDLPLLKTLLANPTLTIEEAAALVAATAEPRDRDEPAGYPPWPVGFPLGENVNRCGDAGW